jgi:hypothetical protein
MESKKIVEDYLKIITFISDTPNTKKSYFKEKISENFTN